MGTLRTSVHLIGRPGMDPEIKKYGDNKKLAKFSLATNERHYNEKMELVQETQWHNIIALGRIADTVEKIVRKGRLMALEGRIQTRQYEDKDKNKRYFTEIMMDEFMLVDKMSNEDEQKTDEEV